MEQVLKAWPTVKAFAAEIGVPYTTAHSWKRRGWVPGEYDVRVVTAASRRGVKLSYEHLARLRDKARACA